MGKCIELCYKLVKVFNGKNIIGSNIGRSILRPTCISDMVLHTFSLTSHNPEVGMMHTSFPCWEALAIM